MLLPWGIYRGCFRNFRKVDVKSRRFEEDILVNRLVTLYNEANSWYKLSPSSPVTTVKRNFYSWFRD